MEIILRVYVIYLTTRLETNIQDLFVCAEFIYYNTVHYKKK